MPESLAKQGPMGRPELAESGTLGTRLAKLTRRPELGAFVAAACVYLLFAISAYQSNFVSIDATAGWLDVAAHLAIIAVPIGLLMIAGEFDLSIGAVVGRLR
jgi:simple sugar transport system permease protein